MGRMLGGPVARFHMQNVLGLLILQGKHNPLYSMSNQSPKIFLSFLYGNVGCLGNTITSFSFLFGEILVLGDAKKKNVQCHSFKGFFVEKKVLNSPYFQDFFSERTIGFQRINSNK
jgi:hypothetical protein